MYNFFYLMRISVRVYRAGGQHFGVSFQRAQQGRGCGGASSLRRRASCCLCVGCDYKLKVSYYAINRYGQHVCSSKWLRKFYIKIFLISEF